jgi:hypothetical protein
MSAKPTVKSKTDQLGDILQEAVETIAFTTDEERDLPGRSC